MLGRTLLFHFSLEGADHEEKVEQENPATSAADDVHNGWVEYDAEYDAEDVEEQADSSDDDPGHHEADILLKCKLSKNGLNCWLAPRAKILTMQSKPTVLVPWIRQQERTKVIFEAIRTITPLVKIPDHGDL